MMSCTLIFVPDGADCPVPEDGIGGNDWQERWLIAPEYDGFGPFWFAPGTERQDAQEPMAMILPLPNGLWYFHEAPDWSDTGDWARRVEQTREAFKEGHSERRLYTKS